MNTYACFIFLLAIGLSAQKSEFDTDFEEMVNTVRLEDNRTLLSCTENCNEEGPCKCHNFTCSANITLKKCIEIGLGKLNLSKTAKIIKRLKLDLKPEEKRKWIYQRLAHKKSPKSFLDVIVDLYHKSNVEKSERTKSG